MTQAQIELVEYALRQISMISQSGWGDIPVHLHPAFARYMAVDAWTGDPDIYTLREAALLIVRDAIARTGEFGEDAA
jgi:hypothetical protein